MLQGGLSVVRPGNMSVTLTTLGTIQNNPDLTISSLLGFLSLSDKKHVSNFALSFSPLGDFFLEPPCPLKLREDGTCELETHIHCIPIPQLSIVVVPHVLNYSLVATKCLTHSPCYLYSLPMILTHLHA